MKHLIHPQTTDSKYKTKDVRATRTVDLTDNNTSLRSKSSNNSKRKRMDTSFTDLSNKSIEQGLTELIQTLQGKNILYDSYVATTSNAIIEKLIQLLQSFLNNTHSTTKKVEQEKIAKYKTTVKRLAERLKEIKEHVIDLDKTYIKETGKLGEQLKSHKESANKYKAEIQKLTVYFLLTLH